MVNETNRSTPSGTIELQRTVGISFGNVYSYLEKMDKFLDIYDPPKLNDEDIKRQYPLMVKNKTIKVSDKEKPKTG